MFCACRAWFWTALLSAAKKKQQKILGAFYISLKMKRKKWIFFYLLIRLHWLDGVLGCFGSSVQGSVFSRFLLLHYASIFPFIPLSKICHLQLIDIQYSGLFRSCMQSSLPSLVWSVITTALHLILALNLAARKLEFIKTEGCRDELPCQVLFLIKF